MTKLKTSADVFLNIPFDKRYEPLFLALIAGLTGMGMTPRCVLEIPHDKTTLDRIFSLIQECPYSIHDLSRVQLDKKEKPHCPRFNMPFEAGLAIALSLSGEDHKWRVFEEVNYRLLKSLSDLNGFWPYIHNGKPIVLLRQITNAFVIKRQHPSFQTLEKIYHKLVEVAKFIKYKSNAETLYERSIFYELLLSSTKIRDDIISNKM
jgi:hypothetical protein